MPGLHSRTGRARRMGAILWWVDTTLQRHPSAGSHSIPITPSFSERTFLLMLKKLKDQIAVQWGRFTGWLDVLERRWKSYWLKRVASATAFAMVAGFTLLALYGPAVSVSYLVTAAGLLLVALSLLVRFKFLQDLATLSGVALAAWWYVQSLPGVFNPVQHVRFDAEPQTSGFFVLPKTRPQGKSQIDDCDFDSASSTLTCSVRVVPVPPEKTVEAPDDRLSLQP